MSYKGNDLELRTPYAPGAGEDGDGQASWSLLPELGRDGPIPVDATVLACCNAAYDAAAFHATRDVRVEHLLYALTRVDAAREVLEQHGLRTGQLRREAATAIAAEAPAVGGRGPRTSPELENVLRRAAGRAGQDSVPASVHDLMRAVLSYGREAPATALLLRCANDPQQLERWAAEAPRQHYAVASLQPAVAQELLGRLESVETAMHAIAAEVAADRKAMLDLMGEIQHELRSAREDSARPAIVLDKIEDVGRSVSGLTERFETIRTIGPGDAVAMRLTALENKLSEQPSAIADAIAYMLSKRRAGAEEPLQLIAEDGAGSIAEKLTSLEAVLRAQSERVEEAGKIHERDLNEIFEALVKLGTNQQTLASNLESWRLDNSGDVSIVSNRLENMERTLQETLAPERSEGTEGNGARARKLKRWLYGTRRVLPSTWRDDAAAIRESFRNARRIEKT
jgi:Clp amino terminal domain, pathogenicity island component